MQKIRVNTGNYDIIIGNKCLDGLGSYVKPLLGRGKALVVTDQNVSKLYLDTVIKSLQDAGVNCLPFVTPGGEENKNTEVYLSVIDELAGQSFTRDDAVVALGGGVCGDTAGFAAATFLRGISLIQVPTTLLSAIDSSVGGKTGINLKHGKNLLGAFHQPRLVYCDTDTFKSLPRSEFLNGTGEGIKYAVLNGGEILSLLQNGLDQSNLERFVTLCALYKKNIVERDEYERGERKLLNLGHTIGHAVEKLSAYTVPHGAAVVKGIYAILTAAKSRGLPQGDFDTIAELIKSYGFDTNIPYPHQSVLSEIVHDKKMTAEENINFVDILGVGSCAVRKASLSEFGEYVYGKL